MTGAGETFNSLFVRWRIMGGPLTSLQSMLFDIFVPRVQDG